MLRLLTVKDVARELGVTPARLYQQLQANEVPRPRLRVGNSLVFRPRDVHAIIVARAQRRAQRTARRLEEGR